MIEINLKKIEAATGRTNLMEDDLMILIINKSPDNSYEIVIEDDGRVAYAYMRDNKEIVADVWLYNHCEAPIQPEWQDQSKMPFANSVKFSIENKLGPILLEGDVQILWNGTTAQIEIHGLLWARLRNGQKPGQCRLALKNGPLAKLLEG